MLGTSVPLGAKINKLLRYLLLMAVTLVLSAGCNPVDDNRIPSVPVNIDLGNAGLWSTYGTKGFGVPVYFIKPLGSPSGFYYTAETATGYGGVLLIEGMDPFTTQTGPLAYDLSCPVECDPNIRVAVNAEDFVAICPDCGSHYDVTMAGGSPISGPAATGRIKYGLRRYKVLATQLGGFVIR